MAEETDNYCIGEHRFFALNPIGIQAEGKVVVILICTQCGELRKQECQVAAPGTLVETDLVDH